jgi:hypothetical protein
VAGHGARHRPHTGGCIGRGRPVVRGLVHQLTTLHAARWRGDERRGKIGHVGASSSVSTMSSGPRSRFSPNRSWVVLHDRLETAEPCLATQRWTAKNDSVTMGPRPPKMTQKVRKDPKASPTLSVVILDFCCKSPSGVILPSVGARGSDTGRSPVLGGKAELKIKSGASEVGRALTPFLGGRSRRGLLHQAFHHLVAVFHHLPHLGRHFRIVHHALHVGHCVRITHRVLHLAGQALLSHHLMV